MCAQQTDLTGMESLFSHLLLAKHQPGEQTHLQNCIKDARGTESAKQMGSQEPESICISLQTTSSSCRDDHSLHNQAAEEDAWKL